MSHSRRFELMVRVHDMIYTTVRSGESLLFCLFIDSPEHTTTFYAQDAVNVSVIDI